MFSNVLWFTSVHLWITIRRQRVDSAVSGDHPHLPYYRKLRHRYHGITVNAVPIPAITAVSIISLTPLPRYYRSNRGSAVIPIPTQLSNPHFRRREPVLALWGNTVTRHTHVMIALWDQQMIAKSSKKLHIADRGSYMNSCFLIHITSVHVPKTLSFFTVVKSFIINEWYAHLSSFGLS